MADTEFGSPAPEDVEASETAAAIAAGIPLEDEDTDRIEEAYEATQREVEEDIHGPVEESEGQEPEETLLAGKYKTVEDLEKGYLNSQSKIGELGPQASESQQLRERLARLEGQAQATRAPAQPQYDPRVHQQQQFAAQRKQTYMQAGFDENTAGQTANQDAAALGQFVDQAITSRTQRYDQALNVNESERHLQANAYHMREEKDASGNPLRPDWDSVVSTKEFTAHAQNLGANFYTKQGLELAYLRTLPVVQGRMQQESSSAAGAAKANSSAAKRRASVGPAATPASKTPSSKTSDDVEIEAIYESARSGAKSGNVFDGGTFD